jgi:NADH-ubiquinone oxidoreductase chain 5
MGGLKQLEPLLYLCFVIGNLAIMGFPFLTGFYSKDLIIEYAYSSSIVDGLFVYVISIISAIFTIIYSVKMLFYVFFSSCLSYRKSFEVYLNGRVGTVNRVELINIPVYVLTILSVIVGYIFHDALGGFGNMFWQESIYNLPQYFAPINCEFIAGTVKLLPFLLSIIFAKFTIFMIYCFEDCIDTEHYSRLAVYDKYAEPLARFCYINYINLIYMRFFNYIYNYSYINFYKFMDKGIFEYIFNILFPRLVLGYYKNNRLLLSKDNNNLFHNIFLYFILCIIVILVLSLMPKFYSVCQIYVGIIVLIIFIKNVKVKDKLKELIY